MGESSLIPKTRSGAFLKLLERIEEAFFEAGIYIQVLAWPMQLARFADEWQ